MDGLFSRPFSQDELPTRWRPQLVNGLVGFFAISGLFITSTTNRVPAQDLIPSEREPLAIRQIELDLFGSEHLASRHRLDAANRSMEEMLEADSMMVSMQQPLEDSRGDDDDLFSAPQRGPAGEQDSGEAENSSPIETFGEAPVDRSREFLRTVTPLLTPGQMQVDYGLVYSLQEDHFPLVVGGTSVIKADVRRRAITVPLAFRYGWDERTQLFLNTPLGWSDTEFATAFGDESNSTGGIGDISFGLTRLLHQNSRTGKSVVGTFRATAPTGNANHPLFLDSTGTGNGVWQLGGDLLMVQNLDPVILFYGAGYLYSFEREVDGFDVQLGHQINYNLGLGFAVNERLTLSTAFLGTFITETHIDGQTLPNSDLEPLRIRMAATIAKPCRLVEPFITFGLTETAPSAQLGVVFTR